MIRLDLTYAEIMLLYFYMRSTMRCVVFFFEWDNKNMLLKHKKFKKIILKDILGQ